MYNAAGVKTYSLKNDQYMLVNSDFDATMDVEVLAAAFNMSKAEFLGHRVLVDSFGSLDTARLAELFANDPNYEEIDSGDLELLDSIPAVVVDRNWFMVFDNFNNFTEQYNGQGLYWNYWYHVWKTFSVSPFANAALFVPGAPGVTSVTVTPDSATISRTSGGTVQLNAPVVTTNFAPQTVVWSSNSPSITVNASGLVTVPAGTNANGAKITATSTYDSSKKDSATITVS